MEGSFLSPPVKRSSNYRSAANGSRKRSKLKPPPLPVPRGHVAFRLLCRTSLVGGFIGKSGSVIQQLQKDTGAKIRVQEAPRASDDRIILVIASSALKNTITLGTRRGREEPAPAAAADGDDAVEDKDTLQVSPAQEALLRVFDRVNEVAEETDGVSKNNGVTVSCRLLAESSQVGSVIGKGGKVIEKIRKASGCKIRVSKGDKLPGCAEANDELVEIEGNLLDVKKALVAISQRLQDYPPVDNYDSHVEQYSTKSALLVSKQSSSVAYTSGLHPLALKADRISILDSETPQQDVVFRLLCSTDTAGGVIGKGGSIVRALQDETGATISIGPAVAECDERLITITASENMESRISPAQNAICLVFARSVEAAIEKGLDSSLNKGSLVSARLVAPSTQVGCLLGKGGAIISEMRRESGAGIRVLGRDQVPKCASGNDQVVQISGEFVNVQDALCHVTARLRDSLFSTTSNGPDFRNNTSVITELSPHLRARDAASLGVHASSAIPHSFNQHTHLTRGLDGLDPHDVDYYSPPKYLPKMVAGVNSRATTEVGRGLTFKGGLELGSGSKSAIVTNTTVEIVVPENVIGSVYGENGSNLTRLRQVSGAKVIVHEPHPGTTDRLVVISGTPDETQAAQSLLQAFILTGPL